MRGTGMARQVDQYVDLVGLHELRQHRVRHVEYAAVLVELAAQPGGDLVDGLHGGITVDLEAVPVPVIEQGLQEKGHRVPADVG